VRRVNRNLVWAGALVDELVRSGIQHFCVSPGSRSAPLALACAAHPGIQDRSILDERSAGFFALGLARGSSQPVGLICTSGTAAANYLPALIEAHYSQIPLVVLTADRPPEDRDCGAGQTIEQLNLYGSYVRLSTELPIPEMGASALRHLRRLACRAVAAALGGEPGPVHLNVPFREPLAPVEVTEDLRAVDELDALSLEGRKTGPMTRVTRSEPPRIADDEVERIANTMRGESCGWLVAGPLDTAPECAEALTRLAHAAGWPLLADPLSQLRAGPHDRSLLIDTHDALLRVPHVVEKALPRWVLRFGAMPTSKAYRLLLERHPEIEQIVVDPWGWRDPTALAAQLIRTDPLVLSRALVTRLAPTPPGPHSDFARRWTHVNRVAREILSRTLAEHVRLSEPGVAQALGEVLPEGSTLFVASSMPIRDLDLFWRGSASGVRVHSNRGANGIDGTVSSALGCALGSQSPLVLLIGDLALLHDWSGLLSVPANDVDVTIVVLDNLGGGIFEFLPVANTAEPSVFEKHFATPQNLDLGRALAGFGLECAQPETVPDFNKVLGRSIGQPGIKVIRVCSDRSENRELHRKLIEAVSTALEAGGRPRPLPTDGVG
jgi:2-succinyl-5-enolpyruvyl-6-hydroxy-3-cyclohexene-1-carboxylate synthase